VEHKSKEIMAKMEDMGLISVNNSTDADNASPMASDAATSRGKSTGRIGTRLFLVGIFILTGVSVFLWSGQSKRNNEATHTEGGGAAVSPDFSESARAESNRVEPNIGGSRKQSATEKESLAEPERAREPVDIKMDAKADVRVERSVPVSQSPSGHVDAPTGPAPMASEKRAGGASTSGLLPDTNQSSPAFPQADARMQGDRISVGSDSQGGNPALINLPAEMMPPFAPNSVDPALGIAVRQPIGYPAPPIAEPIVERMWPSQGAFYPPYPPDYPVYDHPYWYYPPAQ